VVCLLEQNSKEFAGQFLLYTRKRNGLQQHIFLQPIALLPFFFLVSLPVINGHPRRNKRSPAARQFNCKILPGLNWLSLTLALLAGFLGICRFGAI